MSKIEAGRIELHAVTFNLTRLLNDLAAMFRLRAEAKALRFEMLVDGESVPYVVADEGKIRQALINLLGNAIKFTKRGQIKLYVTLEQRGAGLWMSARVEDSGSGISQEDQQKLFEPFTQTKVSHSTQEGTGLGLAISRKYARLMGGDVTVTSSPGKGSIFRFEIPIERGDAGVAIRRSASRRVIGVRAGTQVPGVLVVDDQFENRDWLMKLLTSIGFSVRGAENGEEAVRNCEEWKPGLIHKIPYAGFPTSQTLAQALRPFPQFGNITSRWAPLGNSWYDALQSKITKRYSYGFTAQVAFTWQKELTSGAEGGSVNDVFNLPVQKSLSANSMPFELGTGFTYELPRLTENRFVQNAIHGWTIGGTMRYASGQPIQVPGRE